MRSVRRKPEVSRSEIDHRRGCCGFERYTSVGSADQCYDKAAIVRERCTDRTRGTSHITAALQ